MDELFEKAVESDTYVTDRIILLLTNIHSKGKEELLKLIENYKNDIDIGRIYNGKTILMWTIKRYPDVALKIIKEYGMQCDPGFNFYEGKTALFLACEIGSYELVSELINKFGEECKPSNESDKDGTALIAACNNNSYKITAKIVESFKGGCNPGAYNSQGETALHVACGSGNAKIAMLLLDKFGEKCNIKLEGCTGGRTALKRCDGSIFINKPLEFDMRNVAFKILNNYYTYEDRKKIDVHNIETALKAYEKSINDEKVIDLKNDSYSVNSIRHILERIVRMLILNYGERHWEKPNIDLNISKLNELSFKDGTKVYSTDKYGRKKPIYCIDDVIEVFEKAVNDNDDKVKNIVEFFITKYEHYYCKIT